jgi:hypothetical protein
MSVVHLSLHLSHVYHCAHCVLINAPDVCLSYAHCVSIVVPIACLSLCPLLCPSCICCYTCCVSVVHCCNHCASIVMPVTCLLYIAMPVVHLLLCPLCIHHYACHMSIVVPVAHLLLHPLCSTPRYFFHPHDYLTYIIQSRDLQPLPSHVTYIMWWPLWLRQLCHFRRWLHLLCHTSPVPKEDHLIELSDSCQNFVLSKMKRSWKNRYCISKTNIVFLRHVSLSCLCCKVKW